MTQEQKELVLKDICARLPYRVNVKIEFLENGVSGTEEGPFNGETYEEILKSGDIITSIQPYLRPMSTMTEEEEDEYLDEEFWTDWLLEHHFDYRELIPMGLALRAPEGMYKTE